MTEATKAVIKAALAADASMTSAERAAALVAIAKGSGRFCTARQAADVLAVSTRTVRRMVANGLLKTRRVNDTNKITYESVYAI